MALNTSINTPYLVLTGVVLIAIVFIFSVLQPQLDAITALRHDITQNTNTLKMKQDFIESLSSKVQQLQSQPQAEQQLAVVVPETDMTQDIVRVMSQYASQVGLVITGVTNNSTAQQTALNASIARGDVTATPSDVRTLSFQVSVSGTYGQVRDFLKAIEKSPRIIDVAHLSIKQLARDSGQVSAVFDMKSYSQAQ